MIPNISPAERIYNRIEIWIMEMVPKKNVGFIFKWLFKIPILLYRLGLQRMLGPYFLLLTTTGRKSGKRRHTALEYEYDLEKRRYRVAAGWGGNTDWYRNLRADPHVTVQMGDRKFDALAEPATDHDVARYMMRMSKRDPRMNRIWNRWSDKKVDGNFESYVYAAQFFPSVWLTPERASPPEAHSEPAEGDTSLEQD